MDSVLALLDRLEALLNRLAAPGGERRAELQEASGLLRMIRAALPAELHRAERLREEAEALHRRAGEEARRMLLDAEAAARRAYEEGPGALEVALRRTQLLEEAQAEADRVRRGADEYAAQVLADLEAQVDRILEAIRRGRSVLGPPGR